MGENGSSWESPVVQMLLGVGLVLVIDALVVTAFVFISALVDLVMIAAVAIGFLQWLYVFPLAHRVRRTHYIMARGMTAAAIVLTVVNIVCCLVLREVVRNPVK
jgi:hypothetical protein